MTPEMYRDLPFQQPDELVGRSIFREVSGYDTNNLVIKVNRDNPDILYPNVEHAVKSIQERKRNREVFLTLGQVHGIHADIVPESEYVVHRHPSEAITFTQVQERLRNAQPLCDRGYNIVNLPPHGIDQLIQIFDTSKTVWREERAIADVVGSSQRPYSLRKKVFRRFLPMFYSENIMVTDDGSVRFVDHDFLRIDENNATIKNRLRVGTVLTGSYISSGILKSIKHVRTLQKKM